MNANHAPDVFVAWFGILILLALVAGIGMLFSRRSRPLGLKGLALLGLLICGVYFMRTRAINHPSPTATIVDISLEAQLAQQQALAEMQADMLKARRLRGVEPPSLESIWGQLTAPRINLDESAAKELTESQREVAAAAKVVLSASVPGADPFTQGWLANAAKAIMAAAKPKDASAGETSTLPPSDGAVVSLSSGAAPQAPEPSAPRAVLVQPAIAEQGPPVAIPVKEVSPSRPRPDWVDNPPKLNTRRIALHTDAYSTMEECYARLREDLREVVRQRIEEKAREANGGRSVHVPDLEQMHISMDYILSEICCPEEDYVETVNTSVGEMLKAHALLEFTPQLDELLVDRWRAYARRENVEAVGILSTLVVGALAFVYGLLKIDTWTRGYYTKRLFLGVPAAIIAVLALLA